MANSIKCVDHLGNEFPSRTAMLKHYGLSDVAYLYRLNKMGWSLEKTLTTPPDPGHATAVKCTDHLGNEFASKNDMCSYWNIPRTMFFRRLRDGWTQEQALTTPPKRTNPKTPVTDHLGHKFASVEEMCQYWNTSKVNYIANIRNNYSKKDALTKPTTEYICKDHLGNHYDSINDMCRHYGITKTVLRSRLELGWTLKEILTKPNKIILDTEVEDHLGNKFKTLDDMLEHYHISYSLWTHRRKKLKLSLEETLTADNLHKVHLTDHCGHEFDTIDDFCSYWHISAPMFHHYQKKKGKTLEQIAHRISPNQYNNFGPNLLILRKIKNTEGYYEIQYKNKKLIWSTEQICDFDYRRKHHGKEYPITAAT